MLEFQIVCNIHKMKWCQLYILYSQWQISLLNEEKSYCFSSIRVAQFLFFTEALNRCCCIFNGYILRAALFLPRHQNDVIPSELTALANMNNCQMRCGERGVREEESARKTQHNTRRRNIIR